MTKILKIKRKAKQKKKNILKPALKRKKIPSPYRSLNVADGRGKRKMTTDI